MRRERLPELQRIWNMYGEGREQEVTEEDYKALKEVLLKEKELTEEEKEVLRILTEMGTNPQKVLRAMLLAFNYA